MKKINQTSNKRIQNLGGPFRGVLPPSLFSANYVSSICLVIFINFYKLAKQNKKKFSNHSEHVRKFHKYLTYCLVNQDLFIEHFSFSHLFPPTLSFLALFIIDENKFVFTKSLCGLPQQNELNILE